MTITMERPAEIRSEWNHSCTGQCPQPCPYSSMVERPEVDVVMAPRMADRTA